MAVIGYDTAVVHISPKGDLPRKLLARRYLILRVGYSGLGYCRGARIGPSHSELLGGVTLSILL